MVVLGRYEDEDGNTQPASPIGRYDETSSDESGSEMPLNCNRPTLTY